MFSNYEEESKEPVLSENLAGRDDDENGEDSES
jgi:hypothetical protein